MKPKSFTRILCAAAFVTMLSASSSVFAQVKVGTNPTTIGTNHNLEVEATNNNKTVILKDNGNVGIGQSTPTNKLHVTDAADPIKLEGVQTGTNGDVGLVITTDGVVKKAVPEATPLIRFLSSISYTSGQVFPTGSTEDLIFQQIDFDSYPGSATISSSAAGTIKVPRAGYYQVLSNIHFYDVGAGGTQNFCVYYKKNNTLVSGFEACYRASNLRPASSAATVLRLAAGDVISAFIQNIGTQARTVTGCNLQVIELR